LFDAGTVGTEGLVRFGGRGSWRRLHVVDPARTDAKQADVLREIWARIGRETAHPFPPEGGELLGGVRRELDELTLLVAGVDDPVEASELVDELYEWLPRHTAERADVEDMAVAGRHARSGTAQLRNIIEQVFAEIDPTPPWLVHVDALWNIQEIPDETADTSGQASLFGLDGHVEQPTDIKFGDEWVRFDSGSQADFVRTLAALRMIPRRLAIPPAEIAADMNEQAMEFIDQKQADLRSSLAERIDVNDPGYPDAYVQALSKLAAEVRLHLHAS
jgi:hypothetical protein